jgi:hypothetical protein
VIEEALEKIERLESLCNSKNGTSEYWRTLQVKTEDRNRQLRELLREVKPYINSSQFRPGLVGRVNEALKSP